MRLIKYNQDKKSLTVRPACRTMERKCSLWLKDCDGCDGKWLNACPQMLPCTHKSITFVFKTIVKNNESHLYAIYANPEHVHFLISRSPNISEEIIASLVANSSERFINENKFCQGKFKWQDTCSAFSVSKRL